MAVALVLDRDGTLGAPRIRQHAALSKHCANPPEADRRVVLADYDPRLGYPSLCRFDTAPA
jgi:hypothetical protein